MEEVTSTYGSEEERNEEGQGRQGGSAAKAVTLEQPRHDVILCQSHHIMLHYTVWTVWEKNEVAETGEIQGSYLVGRRIKYWSNQVRKICGGNSKG